MASGRYPASQQVIEDPHDPQHLVVRATYGLLVTRDGGGRWLLICEQAVGYGGNEDPVPAMLGGGTLMAGIFGGLALAPADGCNWRLAQGGVSEMEIVDVSVDPVERARGLALGVRTQRGLHTHRLWETADSGASWQRLGGLFGAELDLLATAFDAAPSDRKRIYVSGVGAVLRVQGVLLRTDNGGVTWTVLPIADTGPSAIPFLTAVASNDRDTIYVRVRASAGDRLLVSSDAGQSWRSVLERQAVMAGFALSTDGTELASASGCPIGRARSTAACWASGKRPRGISCSARSSMVQFSVLHGPSAACTLA